MNVGIHVLMPAEVPFHCLLNILASTIAALVPSS